VGDGEAQVRGAERFQARDWVLSLPAESPTDLCEHAPEAILGDRRKQRFLALEVTVGRGLRDAGGVQSLDTSSGDAQRRPSRAG
jgi:hypothetical protein